MDILYLYEWKSQKKCTVEEMLNLHRWNFCNADHAVRSTLQSLPPQLWKTIFLKTHQCQQVNAGKSPLTPI